MSPRFLTLMAIGLALMGVFWWRTWQSVEPPPRTEATFGCDQSPNCPAHLPLCHTAHGHPEGVCSAPCRAANQCPESWCCAPAEAPGGSALCLPPLTCGRLGLD